MSDATAPAPGTTYPVARAGTVSPESEWPALDREGDAAMLAQWTANARQVYQANFNRRSQNALVEKLRAERTLRLIARVHALEAEVLRLNDRLRLTKSGAEQYLRDRDRFKAENRRLREQAAALKIGLQGLVESYLPDA